MMHPTSESATRSGAKTKPIVFRRRFLALAVQSVARAGPSYEELAKNPMKEVIMSTPAISDGTLIIRTIGHVYGIIGSR